MPEAFHTVYGRGLLSELSSIAHSPYLVVTMRDLWPDLRQHFENGTEPHFVTTLERSELDTIEAELPPYESVIGLGGGQAVDVAKYFAWKRRLPLFQVPTALSVDAPWGHRAAVRVGGIVRYVGYAVPEAVYVDFDIIRGAPANLNRSGAGDILCYWTAHHDWRLATEHGTGAQFWPYDEQLVAEAHVAFDRIVTNADHIRVGDDTGIRALAESLRWGGAAYHNAGWNPRVTEGSEHFFFYNLEFITGRHFIHGQPVTLGTLLMSDLQDNNPERIRAIADRLGMTYGPEQMGVTWDSVAEALRSLRPFVERAGLWHTVVNERVVTETWITRMRDWLS